MTQANSMNAAHFEIDIVRALADQLVEKFEELSVAPLTEAAIKMLEPHQGVYQLFLDGTLVYVGKADLLLRRLSEHLTKIHGRQNICSSQVGFKCLYIHRNWTALAPETSLIDHYRKSNHRISEWNGNGFGIHDPGRQREDTNKAPDGFDARYPIKDTWPCTWIESGPWPVLELLLSLKKGLPYLLRYQVNPPKTSYTKGHPDFAGVTVNVPQKDMAARDLLALIARRLPGWQATTFPSHMILYKESRHYEFGTII
ncbi:GIY-YIG nuclease family protein [Corallococcus carmarthensis]|uniref:GIY-YIG nuclease family protein n=1 Tax=Corallococcus carmarthensis TaxID=2316728 RepID=UPI00148BC045|nr:GIY-YIG nuclease family protein [Corallococcus carmarthensis]NOK17520.1 GIY-YIG nuclease family protein [Corallococcus carmarthensis]